MKINAYLLKSTVVSLEEMQKKLTAA